MPGDGPARPLKTEDDETAGSLDPEKVARNAKRASDKARSNLRRFIVANGLTRMWTPTYAKAEWDRDKVTADVNDWLQRLREYLGENFPAAYVIEEHPGGHGLHVHVALQSRFIDKDVMQSLWGHGLVQFSDGNKAVQKAKGKRAQARMLARYLCKYMAKAWADNHLAGQHRYEVTQGFGVKVTGHRFRTLVEAVRWLGREEGPASSEWSSEQIEDWHGPPCRVFTWD
jgi:hypothetical protein